MLRINVVAIAVILLGGCAMTKHPIPDPALPAPDPVVQQRSPGVLPPSTRPAYNLAGYPKAAQEGMSMDAKQQKSAYGFKDKNRYAADMQYRMGWDDGLSICRSAH